MCYAKYMVNMSNAVSKLTGAAPDESTAADLNSCPAIVIISPGASKIFYHPVRWDNGFAGTGEIFALLGSAGSGGE